MPEPEPDLAHLDTTTLAVRELMGASRDLVARVAKVMAMNPTDMTALSLLIDHGSMGTAELAGRLGIRSASATVLVDRLERAGHVERVRDTGDRRRVVVSETAAARAASLTAWLPVIREIDDLCRGFDAEQAAFLRDVLGRLTATMDRAART